MKVGSIVKLASNHQFHPNREGIIFIFVKTEFSDDVVILEDPREPRMYFCARLSDLQLLKL